MKGIEPIMLTDPLAKAKYKPTIAKQILFLSLKEFTEEKLCSSNDLLRLFYDFLLYGGFFRFYFILSTIKQRKGMIVKACKIQILLRP